MSIYIMLLVSMVCFVRCNIEQTHTIKFRHNEFGHIILPLTIGEHTMECTFDTGASRSSILESDIAATNLKISSEKIWIARINREAYNVSKTKSTNFNIGNIKSKHNITPCINESTFNMRVLGYDIIPQFFWFFDFRKMEVTISTHPIIIDTSNCVSICYNEYKGSIIGSFAIGTRDIVVDTILIDTGGGIFLHDEQKHSIYLALKHSEALVNSINQLYPKANEADNRISTDFPFVADTISPVKDKLPIYKGILMITGQAEKTDHTLSDHNGLLVLGYLQQYSQMYFDTKNQIIYLKK